MSVSHDHPRFSDPEYLPGPFGDAEIPEPSPFDNEPFECAACGKKGWEKIPGTDGWVDEYESDLPAASMTPSGEWTCSDSCRSQLMYQCADERTKSLLRRYHRALSEMAAVAATDLESFLDLWSCAGCVETAPLADALRAIGANPRRGEKVPAWIEQNVAPEERMSAAIDKALPALEYKAVLTLASAVGYDLRMAPVVQSPLTPTTHAWIASALFTITQQMQALAAARDGKAAE